MSISHTLLDMEPVLSRLSYGVDALHLMALGLEETTGQCGLYAVSDYLRDVRQELLSLYGEALNALSLGEAG